MHSIWNNRDDDNARPLHRTLAHMVFPWLAIGAVLIGAFTLIGTLMHVLRR